MVLGAAELPGSNAWCLTRASRQCELPFNPHSSAVREGARLLPTTVTEQTQAPELGESEQRLGSCRDPAPQLPRQASLPGHSCSMKTPA